SVVIGKLEFDGDGPVQRERRGLIQGRQEAAEVVVNVLGPGARAGQEQGNAAVQGGDRVGARRQRGNGQPGLSAAQRDRRPEVAAVHLELHQSGRRTGRG